MFTGVYKIADHVVEISSNFEEVHLLCRDYVSPGETPEITVSTTLSDIAYEREKDLKEAEIEGRTPYPHSDSYLETLAVYRKLANKLLDYDVILFHGCVVVVEDRAYLFTALSGTGKTTHARLWLKNIPGAYILNGDKPLLYVDKKNSKVVAFGTPWQGKENYGINGSMPLDTICVIERDSYNHVEKLDSKSAVPVLIQQSFRTNSPAETIKSLNLINSLIGSVKLCTIYCNMDDEAAIVAYEEIQKL